MMKKKIIGLGAGGRLALKGPAGREEPLRRPDAPEQGTAYLLLDTSESMDGAKLEQARRGAGDFIRQAISKKYGVGLIAFDDHASVAVPRSRNYPDFEGPLSRLDAAGTTNLTEALELAFSSLSALKGARAVVVVSDGAPDDPVSAAAAARKLAAIGVLLITIATEDADTAFLSRIATARDLAIVVGQERLHSGIAGTALALPLLTAENRQPEVKTPATSAIQNSGS